jgi:hypothetical protein
MDPTINSVTAKMYAEYIVRIACWEVEYANLITTRTIEKNFPGLQAQVYENMNFHIPFIYLGYYNYPEFDSLIFFRTL